MAVDDPFDTRKASFNQLMFLFFRCLLLIDSLCDAEYHRTDSGETLASFLAAHLQFLPRWLRIICTVRSNMIDIMKPYPFHRLRYVQVPYYKDIRRFYRITICQKVPCCLWIRCNSISCSPDPTTNFKTTDSVFF